VGRQAISKIENGERGVSVDELFVLAKALGTAPLLLLFPVGAERVIQYLPGRVVDVWSGARWFSGEAYESEDVATHWAIPLYLFRKHDRLLDEYRGIIDVMIVETSEERKAARVARAEEALRS